MDPALRLGLEIRLAPEPDRSPPSGSSARHGTGHATPAVAVRDAGALSEAAHSAGFGSVWLSTSTPQWMDPSTLASALAAVVPGLVVGAVVSLDAGRHPSVVAREMTSVDVVSGGRTALRIGAGQAPAPAVAEAAQICRSLFREARTTFSGSAYHVEDAPNRPPPVRAGGPPLLVDVDGTAHRGAPGGEDLLLRGVDVDAVVVGGLPGTPGAPLATWASVGPVAPAVLWRGPVDADPVVAARTVRTAISGGAAGVIVCVAPGQGPGGTGWIRAIGRALAGALQG